MPMTNSEYQVLARKYRPKVLSELIGQDVLVRTLTHAIEQDRIPHAFLLTGIRGVGKTSTARIIAKALNYEGEDGKQPMTANPKDDCKQAKAIEESRHPDVLEMDAASHTGVGDIREIIESVNYAPTMGRYKIYIIDEVHMLSKSAFNALLKTLEEPPEHCKFIFATTEVRKIPVTILSRCMRFDLPRVDTDTLTQHFLSIAEKEGAKLNHQAARLIAVAAEGSVRDGLSLLDQAIGSSGEEEITKTHIEKMLGTSDRTQLFKLIELLLSGQPKEAVEQVHNLYFAGSEPVSVLGDLLSVSHFLSKLKIDAVHHDDAVSENDRELGEAITDKASVAVLARLWQMLLKGYEELRVAPDPLGALEMICIRIAYASDMPPPNDLYKKLKSDAKDSAASAVQAPSPTIASQPAMAKAGSGSKQIDGFGQLVELCEAEGHGFTATYLRQVHLVKFDAAQHYIEFRLGDHTPADIANKLKGLLNQWTSATWTVALSKAQGAEPLEAQLQASEAAFQDAVKRDPLVASILHAFPGSRIVEAHPADEIAQHVEAEPKNCVQS